MWSPKKAETEQVENLSSNIQHAIHVLEAALEDDYSQSVFLGTDRQADELSRAINGLLSRLSRLNRELGLLRKQADLDKEIGGLLKPNLSAGEVANAVVGLASKEIGDGAALFLYGDESGFTMAASAHRDPDHIETLANVWAGFPRKAHQLLSKAVETGSPVFIENVRVHPLYPVLEELRIRSLILTPVVSGDRILGMLAVATDAEGRELSDQDVQFATVLASHAASALENARLYAQQARFAREAETLYALARAVISSLKLQERLEIIAYSLKEAAEAGRCFLFALEDDQWVPSASYGLTEVESQVFSLGSPSLAGTPVDIRPSDLKPTRVEAAAIARWMWSIALMLDVSDSLVVPIYSAGRVKHIALMDRPVGGRFSNDALRLSAALASLASLAIEQGERISVQLSIAETLRGSLLPAEVPHIEGLEIGLTFRPAERTSGLAGDLYDFISFPDGRWAIVIGDVCGKGLEAATRLAMIKYLIRAYAYEDPSPASVLNRTNQAISHMILDSFVTAAYLLYDSDSGLIKFSSAGHPAVLHCGSETEESCRQYGSSGPPLGIMVESVYSETEVGNKRGDKLVLYTDGITEARRPDGEMFGIKGIERVLHRRAQDDAQEMADALAAEASAYSGGVLKDDIAVIVARIDRRGLFSP